MKLIIETPVYGEEDLNDLVHWAKRLGFDPHAIRYDHTFENEFVSFSYEAVLEDQWLEERLIEKFRNNDQYVEYIHEPVSTIDIFFDMEEIKRAEREKLLAMLKRRPYTE